MVVRLTLRKKFNKINCKQKDIFCGKKIYQGKEKDTNDKIGEEGRRKKEGGNERTKGGGRVWKG